LAEGLGFKLDVFRAKEPGLKTFQKRRSRMKRHVKIGSVLLAIVLLSSFAAAFEKPAAAQAGMSTQLVISGQDVITESDAGGGSLNTRDIVLICVIILAVIGLGVLL
jgi:hypothetical protein